MTAQKLTLCLVVALVVGIATEVASIPNNCTIGYFDLNDRLVSYQDVIVPGTAAQVEIVTKTFNMRQWEKISMIQAVDMLLKTGVTCDHAIKSGPGYVSVVFTFRKPRGQAMNYTLQIYGT